MRKFNWTTNAAYDRLGLQSALFSVVVLLAAWAVIAGQLDSPMILPSPGAVGTALIGIISSGQLWSVLMGTLRHVLLGFSLAFVCAVTFGLLSGRFKAVAWFVYPWLSLLRATPVMSFILYLLLFVPTPYVAVWVSFFVVFPIIYTNLLEGFRSVDKKLLEMAALYGVPPIKRLWHIYAPSIFPYLMAASLTAMGMNIKAVVTAEAMALPEFSVGTELFMARNYLETELILSWTILTIGLAVALDLILLLVKWYFLEGRRSRVLRRRRPEV